MKEQIKLKNVTYEKNTKIIQAVCFGRQMWF